MLNKFLNKNYLPSYGRKRSRPLTELLKQAIEVDITDYEISLEEKKFNEFLNFSKNFEKIYFEIGFGTSEHLIHQAKLNPQNLIIGAEVYESGVARCVYEIKNNSLNNVRVFKEDCRDLLLKLPDGFLDKVFILFPDPWPKEKHKKRRVVNNQLVEILTKKLKKAGVVRFASDNLEYFSMAKKLFSNALLFQIKLNTLNLDAVPQDHLKTKYQKKAEKEKRQSNFFEFILL
jgi:tRNA (guanine-N7-)-methyltransferase